MNIAEAVDRVECVVRVSRIVNQGETVPSEVWTGVFLQDQS